MSNETTNTVAPSADGISFTAAPDRVTITVTGAAFANLREIADVFNRTTGESMTPADILAAFALTSDFSDLARCKEPGGSFQTLPASICEAIRTGGEEGVDDLAEAFMAAGFTLE